MLKQEDNERLTRVGPGTEMGDLWRQFWLPAMLSEELPARDCPPVRLRLLGEDLIAFRDTDGKVGVLDAYCPHRRAPLFFGRNEECGLRCVYHGWKFDTTGQCVDMPNEPPESDFKHKIQTTAYKAEERGGVVWVYMGPQDDPAQLPDLEWAGVPDSHRFVMKMLSATNYMQGLEGDIDSSHAAFLHTNVDGSFIAIGPGRQQLQGKYGRTAPRFFVKDTEYGTAVGARRDAQEHTYYWRITQWMMPSFSIIPSDPGEPITVNARVPLDDDNHFLFRVTFHPDRPLTDTERDVYRNDNTLYPKLIPGTFLPEANVDNDYLIDRAMQKSVTYSGIRSYPAQDQAVNERQGGGTIAQRWLERLGTSDAAIIRARRRLLDAARDLREEGKRPYPALDGKVYRVRAAALELERDVPFDVGAADLLAAP